MIINILLLAVAGALGTLARVGLSGAVQRWAGEGFPAGTLAVNAAGSFLFGLIWPLAEERLLLTPQARSIALAGFMGAFTTFSTFAFETGQFLSRGEWAMAAANLAAQNILGIGLFIAGAALARAL